MNTGNIKIDDYLSVLASKAPIPGGGGASAISGALGAALGAMVCNLTIGKKKYAQVEDDVKAILGELMSDIEDFIELADEDAKVFEPLSKAYSLPKETKEQQEYKDKIMETLLYDAAIAPLRIMKKAYRILDKLEYLSIHGSVLAVSDVGVSFQFIRTAVLGAVMNVKINTKAMKDRNTAESINHEAMEILNIAIDKADKLYDNILGGF